MNTSRSRLRDVLVRPTETIREAIARIDRNTRGIVLVVDEERHLLGTITDGDVRRAILAGTDLDSPVTVLLAARAQSPYPDPTTAPVGSDLETLLALIQKHKVHHLPLLDSDGRVADLVALKDLVADTSLPITAVVMAGGEGVRLRPLTLETPKPMLEVEGQPIMEHIFHRLREAGIRQVNVTTSYKENVIREHFGDGHAFDLDINYLSENQPLGTAGGLGQLERPEAPVLVINGDILTRVDFRALLTFHQEHGADMTVGVHQHDVQIPYGTVEIDGVNITRLAEKPTLRFFVNAGIYLLDPIVHGYLSPNQRLDMTDLVAQLLHDGRRVISFPIREYWRDIGQPADYAQAREDAEKERF